MMKDEDRGGRSEDEEVNDDDDADGYDDKQISK